MVTMTTRNPAGTLPRGEHQQLDLGHHESSSDSLSDADHPGSELASLMR